MSTLLKVCKLLGLVREETIYKNPVKVADDTLAVAAEGIVHLQTLEFDQFVAKRSLGFQFESVPEGTVLVSTGREVTMAPFADDQFVGRRGTSVYFEDVPSEKIVIPRGASVQGEIHTNMSVVVAGTLEGTVNIVGNQDLILLEGSEVRDGLVSADRILVKGTLRNSAVDVETLQLPEGGRLEGNNTVRYANIRKHDEAPLNGRFLRRTGSRDHYTYENRIGADVVAKS